jgi:hypothetical protein
MATTSDSPLLTFDADTHRYTLAGRDVRSVTTALRLANYVNFYGDILDDLLAGRIRPTLATQLLQARFEKIERARDRGKRVHLALHFLFDDDLDDDSIDDEVRGYLQSAQGYLARHVVQIYRAEFRVWSLRNWYAGTCDLLAVHDDGLVSVDDFKTGDPADVAAHLQTAGYLGAALEMARQDADLGRELRSHGPVVRRRSLRLFRDGRPARETVYSDPRDFTRFLTALAVANDLAANPVPLVDWEDER